MYRRFLKQHLTVTSTSVLNRGTERGLQLPQLISAEAEGSLWKEAILGTDRCSRFSLRHHDEALATRTFPSGMFLSAPLPLFTFARITLFYLDSGVGSGVYANESSHFFSVGTRSPCLHADISMHLR